MEGSVTALIGIESGLLKGLDSIRWTVDAIQNFSEVLAASSVIQGADEFNRLYLRVVVKVVISIEPDFVIEELINIENEFEQKMKIIEPVKCYLLTYNQLISLTPRLTLPFPEMIDHSSWLYCSWEVWKNYRHPVLDLTLERLLQNSNMNNIEFFGQGKSVVRKL